MPVIATCPCGERFNLRKATFPRPISCHQCGERTLLRGIRPGDQHGWRVEEEPDETMAENSHRCLGAAVCRMCPETPSGACNGCGGFYCPWHGRARKIGGSTCVRCCDSRRPLMVAGALLAALVGSAMLALPYLVPELQRLRIRSEAWLWVPVSLPLFFTAGWSLWSSVRSFP
jgi:hypothetical protein